MDISNAGYRPMGPSIGDASIQKIISGANTVRSLKHDSLSLQDIKSRDTAEVLKTLGEEIEKSGFGNGEIKNTVSDLTHIISEMSTVLKEAMTAEQQGDITTANSLKQNADLINKTLQLKIDQFSKQYDTAFTAWKTSQATSNQFPTRQASESANRPTRATTPPPRYDTGALRGGRYKGSPEPQPQAGLKPAASPVPTAAESKSTPQIKSIENLQDDNIKTLSDPKYKYDFDSTVSNNGKDFVLSFKFGEKVFHKTFQSQPTQEQIRTTFIAKRDESSPKGSVATSGKENVAPSSNQNAKELALSTLKNSYNALTTFAGNKRSLSLDQLSQHLKNINSSLETLKKISTDPKVVKFLDSQLQQVKTMIYITEQRNVTSSMVEGGRNVQGFGINPNTASNTILDIIHENLKGPKTTLLKNSDLKMLL